MAEKVVGYALTTKNRVKDRLQLTTAQHDVLLDRLVSAASDFIEAECGRRFKSTPYSNEVYSVYGERQDFVFLKQAPVTALTSAQYRAGTPSNPSWTGYTADEFELVEDGKSGIVKIYGNAPKGTNTLRFIYTAGYLIDFDNVGDTTKHTLPLDLSDFAERLVVKLFKKRDAEGKATESYEGGSVTWNELLDEVDKQILARYRRLPTFV